MSVIWQAFLAALAFLALAPLAFAMGMQLVTFPGTEPVWSFLGLGVYVPWGGF